jgi:2,4-dienoyl-CoA reductase (NADPH2)
VSSDHFPKLLAPGYIGRVRLKNRIIKTAQGSSTIEPDSGFVGDRCKAYYDSLASGGVGLLIVESCGVEYPLGVHHPPVQFRLHDDTLIPSFTELTRVVHQHDCPIFLQLIHSGPWNPTGFLKGRNARCSSTLTEDELPGPDFVETKEMAPAEVAEVIEMFVKSAERAKKAGFDGVEINAGTCTLPNSFLSRVFNKRQDEYGIASLEDRARFVTDILSGIKERLGSDFAVTVLINIVEFGSERATTIGEGVRFAGLMQRAGADAIQVRAHYYGHRGGLLHPDRFFYPELKKPVLEGLDWSNKGKGAIVPLAEAVKRVVTVPVIAAGRLDPLLGEKLLRERKLDFVGMTRRLLADPELPRKVTEARLEDVRPCLGCLHCMDVRLQNKPVTCRVNARLNRERELTYAPARQRKKVLVVGSGPAGMEAARVAALRGHQVILYEKERRLGGLLNIAALVKDLELDEIMALVRYFKVQFDKLGVNVRLGREATVSVINEAKPDVVIVAVGGRHTVPPIPGIENSSVLTSSALHRTIRFYLRLFTPKILGILTKYWMPLGRRVVIIGGRIQGCEVAEFLVKRGRQVVIVDCAEALGEGMTGDDKSQLFPWFDKKGVKRFLGVQYNRITDKGLVITTKEGEELTLEADTVITASPLQSAVGSVENLKGSVAELHFVGDCREPGLIAEATADGAIIANSI